MDINITTIWRWYRNLAHPALTFTIGMAIMIAVGRLQSADGPLLFLGNLAQSIFPWTPLIPLVALCWAAYAAWTIWRWENGDRNGPCLNCGGPMSSHTGRYGDYSVCKMRASKREGWH